MQYELISKSQQGKQILNQDGSITVYFNVTAGIVGDTYGFTKTTTTSFNIADFANITGTQMEASAQAQAVAYVSATYPNT